MNDARGGAPNDGRSSGNGTEHVEIDAALFGSLGVGTARREGTVGFDARGYRVAAGSGGRIVARSRLRSRSRVGR